MAKKKEMDNISLNMIQCEKDGYGVHYGRWKATQPIAEPEPEGLPKGWKVCPYCGKEFKPRQRNQIYCEAICGYNAQRERRREKAAAYEKEYRARRKEMQRNESYT